MCVQPTTRRIFRGNHYRASTSKSMFDWEFCRVSLKYMMFKVRLVVGHCSFCSDGRRRLNKPTYPI